MQEIVTVQYCCNCGERFIMRYFEDGCFEFLSETCDCDAAFEPIDGELSMAEWLESLKS